MLVLPMLSWFATADAVTLDEAWKAAEAHNLDLRLLHEQTRQVETLRLQASALVQPKVVAGASYTINEKEIVFDSTEMFDAEAMFESFGIDPETVGYEAPEPIVVQQKEYLAWNASVVQPLFDATAIPLMRAAKHTVAAQRETEASTRVMVRAGVARAYWGVLLTREAVAISEQALANAKAHEQLAAVQVTAGTAAPTAKLQGEIAVARAERELMRAREGATTASVAFATLTGLPADAPVEAPDLATLPFADPDGAVRYAVDRQPSVRAADLQARAANMSRLATDLGWLPTATGRFTYSYSGNTGMFMDDPTLWMVVFEANWTLWDGGYRVSQEAKAASQKRMAEVAAERARQQVEERIRGLWATHARAETALGTVDRELTLARENLRLAEAAFAAGMLTWLELEDARLGVQAAQFAALQQRMDRDLAAMDLLAAAGEL